MNESENRHLTSVEVPHEAVVELLERISKNNKGEPYTWGATPLSISAETLIQQSAVKGYMSSLFNKKHRPSYVPDEIAPYAEGINMGRTAQRESRNTDSYKYRGITIVDNIPLEVLGVIDRALRGAASPAELLFVAQTLEIPTIEVASLTHPFGQRIELLKKMRPAVNEAIEMMDGVLVDGRANPLFEIKGSDSHHQTMLTKGLHVTRKTDFGILPDDTDIIERSSFVLLVDKLPKRISDDIKEIQYGKTWSRDVRMIHGLQDTMMDLLEDDRHDTALPISTTVVARNPELEARLLSKEAIHQRQRDFLAAYATNKSLI